MKTVEHWLSHTHTHWHTHTHASFSWRFAVFPKLCLLFFSRCFALSTHARTCFIFKNFNNLCTFFCLRTNITQAWWHGGGRGMREPAHVDGSGAWQRQRFGSYCCCCPVWVKFSRARACNMRLRCRWPIAGWLRSTVGRLQSLESCAKSAIMHTRRRALSAAHV